MEPGSLLVAYILAVMLIPLCICAYALSYMIEVRENNDLVRASHKLMRGCVMLAVPYFIVMSLVFHGLATPDSQGAKAETTDNGPAEYAETRGGAKQPEPGTVESGHVFLGGDPANPDRWAPFQAEPTVDDFIEGNVGGSAEQWPRACRFNGPNDVKARMKHDGASYGFIGGQWVSCANPDKPLGLLDKPLTQPDVSD